MVAVGTLQQAKARLTALHVRVLHARRHTRQTRTAIVIGALFFSVFAVLDYYLFPEQLSTLLLIRFSSLPLISLVILVLTRHPHYPRWAHLLLSAGIMIPGFALTAMEAITAGPENYTYFAGILVVLYYGYGLLLIPFVPAVIAGTTITIVHALVVLGAGPENLMLTIAEVSILFSVNTAGALMAGYRDRLETRETEARHALAIKQAQLREGNDRLEARVATRTAELSQINDQLSETLEELEQRDRELEQKLRERSHLLQEIHHRVGNNLQTIGSMLELEAASIGRHEESALQRMEIRVRSMANVHHLLYASDDFSTVPLGEIILGLAGPHGRPGSIEIPVQISSREIRLTVGRAIPAALLINELVTILREQASGNSAGIRLEADGEHHALLTLTGARLNGSNSGFECKDKLTGTLVTALVAQLEGTIGSANGSHEVVIRLPIQRLPAHF